MNILKRSMPPALQDVRAKASRALGDLRLLSTNTEYDAKKLFMARRTNAGRTLPPYYLVYFLLVDLLDFPCGGPFDKTAWSIAVEWKGQAFLIDHRKMGLGIFAQNVEKDEEAAQKIAIKLHKAIKAAQPFFDWLASDAVARSAVNVINNSSDLFGRYSYLRDSYHSKREEYDSLRQEYRASVSAPATGSRPSFPPYKLATEANWCALSAVEAFFAWTEHVLIHLAVLLGNISSAQEVADLAESDWSKKFRAAFSLGDDVQKSHYDRLLSLRQELRNYVAHGAFGKQGEAFQFHSGAGAVPVLLPHRVGSRKFKFAHGLSFDAKSAIEAMDAFIDFVWSGHRAPAKIYIQDSGLRIILTYAADGTYRRAMQHIDSMQEFVDYKVAQQDRAMDMDW